MQISSSVSKTVSNVTHFLDSSQGKVLRVALGIIFMVIALASYFLGGGFTTSAALFGVGLFCFSTFVFERIKNCCRSLKEKSLHRPKRSLASFQQSQLQAPAAPSPQKVTRPPSPKEKTPPSSPKKTAPQPSPAIKIEIPDVELTKKQKEDLRAAEKAKNWNQVVTLLGECLKLIELIDDMSARDDKSQTLLHHVALHPTLHPQTRHQLTEILIHFKATVNARDKFGRIPLHYAMDVPRKVECVTSLLKGGSDLETIDSEGFTPLFYCVKRGQHEIYEGDVLGVSPLKPKEEALFAHLQAMRHFNPSHFENASFEGMTLPQVLFKERFSESFKAKMKNPDQQFTTFPSSSQFLDTDSIFSGTSTFTLAPQAEEIDFDELVDKYTSGELTSEKRVSVTKIVAELQKTPGLISQKPEAFIAILEESEIALINISELKVFFEPLVKALPNINQHFGPTKETLLHKVQNEKIKEEIRFLLTKLLLDAKARKDIKDWRDKTPLEYTVKVKDNQRCAELLK